MADPKEREAVVLTEGLTKRFGKRLALDDVTLRVYQGEIFALVGPDGAGKTTAIRILCGIMDPEAGHAHVLGFDTVRQAQKLSERIGYMPQRFGMYDDLTVAENVRFYADLYGVPRAERERRMNELLAFAGLDEFPSRPAGQLSGGMRQKLELICTLIHTPRLLFLDEPTFGVDPVSRREFWRILYKLLGTGMTIFLSTAYLDEAERAHRVGLLDEGRLLAVDSPAALKAGFTGELLEVRGAALREARRLLEEQSIVRQVLTMGDRLLLTVEDQEQARGPIARILEDGGLKGMSLDRAEPALEDVLIQFVGERRHDG